MDFNLIKKRLKENRDLLAQDIDPKNPASSGLQMAHNKAGNEIEQLKKLERSLLGTHANLFLVEGAQLPVLEAFAKKGALVTDHLSLARSVATRFWPQFRQTDTINAFFVNQMNEYMDSICQNLGLDNFRRPTLKMSAKYQRTLSSEEDLVNLLEEMFEQDLKNNEGDPEGHVLQALVSCQDLLSKFDSVDKVSSDVTFVVSVPVLGAAVIDAYKNLLTVNVFTASFKNKTNNKTPEELENWKEGLRKAGKKGGRKTAGRANPRLGDFNRSRRGQHPSAETLLKMSLSMKATLARKRASRGVPRD